MIFLLIVIIGVNLWRRYVKPLRATMVIAPCLGVNFNCQQSSIVVVHLRTNHLLSVFGAGEAGMKLIGSRRMFFSVGHFVLLSSTATDTGVHYIFPVNNSKTKHH